MSSPGTHAHLPFDQLVEEAEAVPVDGWDFSWFAGRATEERPPWGYARLMGERWAQAASALDLDTGGGEVLNEAPGMPALAAATEAWPPNVERATALLKPRGVVVVSAEPSSLPFADGTFALVTARHPATLHWGEAARVLEPGGVYFAQHVGPASVFELVEYFLGPQPQAREGRRPDVEAAGAREVGLEVVDLRTARTRIEFFDIGAVVHFLRKVVWMVPGFTVERYRGRLRELDAEIRAKGPFVAHSTRHLIEARRPAR